MPGDTITIPVPGEGEAMSTDATTTPGDIDQDCCEVLLESLVQTDEALATETQANAEMAHNLVRLAAARKYNREDPIEAAAAEVIMRKKI